MGERLIEEKCHSSTANYTPINCQHFPPWCPPNTEIRFCPQDVLHLLTICTETLTQYIDLSLFFCPSSGHFVASQRVKNLKNKPQPSQNFKKLQELSFFFFLTQKQGQTSNQISTSMTILASHNHKNKIIKRNDYVLHDESTSYWRSVLCCKSSAPLLSECAWPLPQRPNTSFSVN